MPNQSLQVRLQRTNVDISLIEKRIERFAGVFHRYVCSIASISLGEHDERYRKVLYFTIIEGLAKARYPKERPGSAFSSFVVKYCRWAEGDKVSLPHLVAALERTDDNRFDSIRNDAFSRYCAWDSGGPRGLESDPTKAEVQKLWPVSDSKPVPIPALNLTWRDLQHRSLLYAYRSKLAHESREPTMSFEEAPDRRPFYESVCEIRVGNESEVTGSLQEWHLVYPSGFLENLCHTGVEGLKTSCLANQLDPYERFNFGSLILDCLNDTQKYPVKVPFSRKL